eukprot:2791758-Rhodomonas_salina.1
MHQTSPQTHKTDECPPESSETAVSDVCEGVCAKLKRLPPRTAERGVRKVPRGPLQEHYRVGLGAGGGA